MEQRPRDIRILVDYDGATTEVLTYEGEYRNLMVLIRDKVFFGYFGECGGQGRCGTCVVEVIEAPPELQQYERNEARTLERNDISDPKYRLACQIYIDKARLNDAHFRVWES